MRSKGKRFAEKPHKYKKNTDTISTNQHKNSKVSNKKHHFISNFIILVCIATIVFSGYKIVYWIIENNKNNSILDDIHTETTITHEEVPINNDISLVKINYDLSGLLKKNSKIVGWIYVPNTNIDYPVLQDNNNDFYLNHSFDNSTNSAGWVFADYICDIKNSDNVIIYGHNRKDSSMFGSLKCVLDDNWLSDNKNQYITFANLDETGIYQIFSTFIVNDADVNSYLSTDFATDEEFHSYVNNLKKHSCYDFKTDTDTADKMITLYTCYGLNNQRLLVFAVKVL